MQAMRSQSELPSIAVSALEPEGKASFVEGCTQTRLMGHDNGERPISLVYVSKPLITVKTAVIFISVEINCNFHPSCRIGF